MRLKGRSSLSVGLVTLALGALWPACSNDDHGDLARRNGGAGSSVGGSPAFPSAGFGGVFVITGGRASGGAGGRTPDEPPGTNALTLVHGIVDAPSVRLCWVVGSGADKRYVEPRESPTLLDFGNVLRMHGLDDVDLAEEELQPLVIRGDLTRVEELDCEEAVELARLEQARASAPVSGSGGQGGGAEGGAGGAPEATGGAAGAPEAAGGAEGDPEEDATTLRVAELPALPAGTLSSGRSLLFVMRGCMGGPSSRGSFAELACGVGYTPTRPTLGAILVPMSRSTRSGRLGMQVLHAAMTESMLTLQTDGNAGALQIQGGVEPGVILPRVARADLPAAEWHIGLPEFHAQVVLESRVVLSESWETVLERSDLERVADGKNYVAIILGPHPDIGGKGFWNRPAVALVASDPDPSQ